jgi:hypothetical protein
MSALNVRPRLLVKKIFACLCDTVMTGRNRHCSSVSVTSLEKGIFFDPHPAADEAVPYFDSHMSLLKIHCSTNFLRSLSHTGELGEKR